MGRDRRLWRRSDCRSGDKGGLALPPSHKLQQRKTGGQRKGVTSHWKLEQRHERPVGTETDPTQNLAADLVQVGFWHDPPFRRSSRDRWGRRSWQRGFPSLSYNVHDLSWSMYAPHGGRTRSIIHHSSYTPACSGVETRTNIHGPKGRKPECTNKRLIQQYRYGYTYG